MTAHAAREWAASIIRAAQTDYGRRLPTYGSSTWGTLDAPQRWASALVAAECWRIESDPEVIRARLAAELDATRLLEAKLAEDASYVAARDAWRRDWLPRLPGFRADAASAREIERDWRAWLTGEDAA